MIAEFYDNSEIFITGGSGVVGKAAIEKLLRSCNVKKIYVLLRCKKGVSSEDRLEDMKNSKIFKVLKERKPNELDKLVAIPGNIALEGLGITTEHREMIKNVSVFFHSAATTRFVEPLKSAICLNVKSTLESLKIAETLPKLRIFVHISTYFSNPYLTYIEDKVYPAVFDYKTALKMLENDTIDPVLDMITNKVITGFPNTYVFTKHLAEQLVNDYRFKLPVAIYKPSIVVSAFDEPEKGFMESVAGMNGLMVIWGTGLVQTLLVHDKKNVLDVTPLDLGTKTLLMFAALKSQLPREKFIEAIPIGKFSSSTTFKMPILEHCNLMTESVHKYPLEKSFWIPDVTVTPCPFVYWTLLIFLQLIPALLVDLILKIVGQKPFMMQIQRKAFITFQALDFFIKNPFRSDGVSDLDEMLKIGKGTEFDMEPFIDHFKDLNSISAVIDDIAIGCRKYIFDEPESSIERCKKILMAKKIAYNILKGGVAILVLRAIYRTVMKYLEQ